MDNLVIALIQFDIKWRDKKANISFIETLVQNSSQVYDILILPELFTTGFSVEFPEDAEMMDGESVNWMLKIAKRKNALICGSIIISSNENNYNRFIAAHPDGTIDFYDKRHLFGMGKENQYFQAGTARKIIDYKGWKILPQICYDLRFPVWSRNRDEYDLAIYVANWPETRIGAWTTLLKARSIENQCIVVGVNRIGTDGNNLNYCGKSIFIGAGGTNLGDVHTDTISSCTFQREVLKQHRKKLPFLRDRDSFVINE